MIDRLIHTRALTYEFLNEPKSHTAATMAIHRGTASLRLQRSDREDVLEGEYYTGRGRTNHGALRLVRTKGGTSAPAVG